MKITSADVEELSDLLIDAESFRPLIIMLINTIKSYGPELKALPEAFLDFMVESNTRSFKKYTDNNFSRAEAMLLTLDHKLAMGMIVKSFNDSKITQKSE